MPAGALSVTDPAATSATGAPSPPSTPPSVSCVSQSGHGVTFTALTSVPSPNCDLILAISACDSTKPVATPLLTSTWPHQSPATASGALAVAAPRLGPVFCVGAK